MRGTVTVGISGLCCCGILSLVTSVRYCELPLLVDAAFLMTYCTSSFPVTWPVKMTAVKWPISWLTMVLGWTSRTMQVLCYCCCCTAWNHVSSHFWLCLALGRVLKIVLDIANDAERLLFLRKIWHKKACDCAFLPFHCLHTFSSDYTNWLCCLRWWLIVEGEKSIKHDASCHALYAHVLVCCVSSTVTMTECAKELLFAFIICCMYANL